MSGFLAPIHDYTDLPFRLLCQRYGAGGACVPLVSSAMAVRSLGKAAMVDAHPAERNTGIQLFGNDAGLIGRAARIIEDEVPHAKWLNLNCGCPSSRTMNDGSGSAMLAKPGLIHDAVAAMRKASGKEVSAKIRINGGFEGTLEICRAIESAGADFIIIHARTVAQGYSGRADWAMIRELRGRLSVQVIGNGDIASASEGNHYVRDGFCDNFMAGRGAMSNPMLFCDKKPDGLKGRMALLGEYAALHREYAGEPELHRLKAKALCLMKGIRGAAGLRDRICRAASEGEILDIAASPGEESVSG